MYEEDRSNDMPLSGTRDAHCVGVGGVKEEDLAAYKANYSTHKVGISVDETVHNYDLWAQRGTYEKDLAPGRYNGPSIAVSVLTRYFSVDRRDVRLLDVAAGTGFVGEKLQENGFTHIDALEPSRDMLHQAEEKAIYTNHICDVMGDKETNISKDTYDGLVISGGMGEGHIPRSGLLEMIRIVKPGGLVVIVMREEYLSYVKEYVGRLEPMMETLQVDGAWSRQERTVVPNYSFGKNGVVFVYKVQAEGNVDIKEDTEL